MSNKYYIIDFDSTFIQVETLEVLGDIALNGTPDKHAVLEKIKSITDAAMDGSISFTQALEQRIALLHAKKEHLEPLTEKIKTKVSKSFMRNAAFLKQNHDNIYIISSGFKEFIIPVVEAYGIDSKNVYANTFEYDSEGKITGFDRSNPLSKDKGKVEQIQLLNLPSNDVYVIGDGYTDYEIREAGLAHTFYAFTENIERSKVIAKADHVAPTLDEVLYHAGGVPMAVSYPKNRIKVLILENIDLSAKAIFEEEGYTIEIHNAGMDEDELCERVKDVSILCIRSKTIVTEKVLQHANKLIAVGAFCIGTNQIDLAGCTKRGIAVFNAPYSNTRSVVELAIGEIIMLMRNIVPNSNNMHVGKWNKSATNCFEIRGKKLGIIGFGNIGTQLLVVAEALGMEVYYYDIVEKLAIGNVKQCKTLEELLSISDVVTLHVDGRKSNANLIGEKEFALMKDGVVFLNLSRGHVVDIPALVKNLKNGKIKGAAVDVFPEEPKSNKDEFISELRGFENVILSPHVGGSTEEAQVNIGKFVPGKIIQYINSGATFGSVNLPEIQLSEAHNSHRIIHIHENVPGVLAKINSIFAKYEVNILAQYLKTNELVGCVVTDLNKKHEPGLIADMKAIEGTIRFRVLY